MPTVVGLPGANGTNGLAPTAGKKGGSAVAAYSGMVNVDSQTIIAIGGGGGTGGNNTGPGAGAKGGDGGDATATASGNIFKPLGPSFTLQGVSQGGIGGAGGTGAPAGSQGNGGNATTTLSGNILSTSTNLGSIFFSAVASAGAGIKSGNATSTISGNVITYNGTAQTNVFLGALAN